MATLAEGTALIPKRPRQVRAAGNGTEIERRSKVRYPLDSPISYRSLREPAVVGDGLVENMSSTGLCVVSPHQPCVGTILELRMRWPTLLEQRVPLQFIAVAKVVRCGGSSFAVLFRKYQFRTGAVSKLPWLALDRPVDKADGSASPKARC